MKECIIKQEKGPGFYFSVRFMVACLIFCASAIQYTQKIDMSIGIVCMVNKTALTISDKLSRNSLASSLTDTEEICMFSSSDANNGEANDGPFIWSKRIQGLILSSYFYGYIILQIPSGWLSKKIGGQRVLGISMFLGSLMTLLVPFSAKFGYHSLIICRFLNGLVHGAVFPAVCSIFVKWAPPAEKSRLIGFACSGSYIGNVIALPLGSFLCMHGFDGGWPSIFYFFGVVGIAWCGIFMYLTSNSPKNHHFITRAEREYIAAKISPINSENSNRKIPWSLIIKSKACLALFSSNFCANWANYLFLTQLPSFMNDILKFDIKSNGLYSTLPYITCWFVAITSAVVSDQLIASKNLIYKKCSKTLQYPWVFNWNDINVFAVFCNLRKSVSSCFSINNRIRGLWNVHRCRISC